MKLIGCPFCSQNAFEDAQRVLSEAKVPASPESPVYGMDRPFYAPGGYYGQCWWSLDYALALEGAKWLDFAAARDLIHNLRRTQRPDGRVMLYGADSFAHIPSVKEDVASLPKYFETCYDICMMSGDVDLCRETVTLFENSLAWWIRNRYDPETGLFSAVFEETFVPNTHSVSGVYAPVDTQFQLMLGMENTASLIRTLERKKGLTLDFIQNPSGYYQNLAQNTLESARKWLYNGQKGAFFPYVLTQKRQYPALLGSTFMGFYVPEGEVGDRLEALLRDPDQFGWGRFPISSAALTDPLFTTVAGDYNGNPAWCGSVWTLINDQTAKALIRSGRQETAAELIIATLAAFSGAGDRGKAISGQGNFAEFLNPFTGHGEGALRYAWSAGQCIRMVVEAVFGLRYDGFTGVLTAAPLNAGALRDSTMRLEDIPLPDGRRAWAALKDGKVEIGTEN